MGNEYFHKLSRLDELDTDESSCYKTNQARSTFAQLRAVSLSLLCLNDHSSEPCNEKEEAIGFKQREKELNLWEAAV